MTTSSAKAPVRSPAKTGAPFSSCPRGCSSMSKRPSQREARPRSQWAQWPQVRSRVTMTSAPGYRSSGMTPVLPTSVTTPAASWPKTVGQFAAPAAVHVDDVGVADGGGFDFDAHFAGYG